MISTRWALPIIAMFWITPAVTGVGQLDPGFGSGGYVLIPFDLSSTPNDQADAVLVQPDGRILVGGFAQVDDNRDFALARLLPDGSLDASFGSGGKLTVSFDLGGFSDNLSALEVYADGRILAAGTAENVDGLGGVGAWAVARLTSSGGLDTSFNLGGKVVVNVYPGSLTSGSALADMVLLPDGRILLAGYTMFDASDARATVVRLNADGSLDTGFGTDGISHIAVSNGDPALTLATGMAADSSGRSIVVGVTNTDTEGGLNLEMFAIRLLEDGTPDPGFGSDGVRLVPFDLGAGSTAMARAIEIDSQGRIVIGGGAVNLTGNMDFAAVRMLANGNLDSGFGTGGRVLVGFDLGGSNDDAAADLAIDSDGRIYLAGRAQVASSNEDVAVLRLQTNGLPDTSFGNNGKFTFGLDNDPPTFVDDFARAIVLDANERPIIAGATYLGPQALNYDMLVLRLTGERLFRDRFEQPVP